MAKEQPNSPSMNANKALKVGPTGNRTGKTLEEGTFGTSSNQSQLKGSK